MGIGTIFRLVGRFIGRMAPTIGRAIVRVAKPVAVTLAKATSTGVKFAAPKAANFVFNTSRMWTRKIGLKVANRISLIFRPAGSIVRNLTKITTTKPVWDTLVISGATQVVEKQVDRNKKK